MISPTGNNTIRMDSLGSGKYGARRKNRYHKGVDYECLPGEYVFAPISGNISREAIPYANKEYSGCVIVGKLQTIKMFYFKFDKSLIGKQVAQGDIIGTAQDISKLHGSEMLPHIHVEIISIDPDLFINQL